MYQNDHRLLASQRRGGAQVSHAGVQRRGAGARGGFRGNIGEIRHAGHERPGGVQVRHARGKQRLFDSCVGRGVSWREDENSMKRSWGGVESVCSQVSWAPVPVPDIGPPLSHVQKRILPSDLYLYYPHKEKGRHGGGGGVLIFCLPLFDH